MLCFSDRISAGYPSAAEGYEDEPLNLHDWLVIHPAATFFYRVKGDVLKSEYVRDGAILIVDRSVKPVPGRLVLTEEDGQSVVRRFHRLSDCVVVGVVVGIVTKF